MKNVTYDGWLAHGIVGQFRGVISNLRGVRERLAKAGVDEGPLGEIAEQLDREFARVEAELRPRMPKEGDAK